MRDRGDKMAKSVKWTKQRMDVANSRRLGVFGWKRIKAAVALDENCHLVIKERERAAQL